MNEQKVILMRGLPGSGKSTWIKDNYSSIYNRWVVFSADSYRYVNGVYIYDPKTDTAHQQCFCDYLEYICDPDEGAAAIIVDNTNISAWECAPYILAAQAYGREAEIITIICDPAVVAARNTHGVPPETIFKMYQRLLSEQLPPHWKNRIIFSS